MIVATFIVALGALVVGVINLRRQKKQMADIDILNANVAKLVTDTNALTAEVAAIVPSAPVDLTGAIAGTAAADAAVEAATAELQAKFPPAAKPTA